MPTHLIAIAAELILLVTAFSVALELLGQKHWPAKLAALCISLVGIAASLGALRYAELDVVQYHELASGIAGHVGMVGFVVLLALKINRQQCSNLWFYGFGAVSLVGYAFALGYLKDVALIVSMLLLAVSIRKQQLPGYHFFTALIALFVGGGLALNGFTSGSLNEALFHLCIAATIHQYHRQFCYRI
ncbi:hypothetical protein QX776_13750 [Alteromonadaceae bacterium BrNp21-10]|nr:hypothetical protein [Alteromonadaceae bacterium BrNp21-10]